MSHSGKEFGAIESEILPLMCRVVPSKFMNLSESVSLFVRLE